MVYSVEFDRIERSWQPNSFIIFMESNPITNLFWELIKCCCCCCGYEQDYRVNDWDDEIRCLQSYRTVIVPGHPEYMRYYRAVQHVLYYNPHLRADYAWMPAPISNPVYVPVSSGIRVGGYGGRRVPPPTTGFQVGGGVPPPTTGFAARLARPLAGDRYVPPPTMGSAGDRARPLAQDGRADSRGEPLSRQQSGVPLAGQGDHRR